MWKKISLMLILLLMVSVFALGCGSETEAPATDEDLSLTTIQDKGTLVLGCDDGFPPMGFRDKNGEVVGFDIDLAKAVADKLGVELVVKPINWETKELELKNGSIDVIWNGFTINAKRNRGVEYTKPYLNNEIMLAVKADSPIQTKADLAGKIVGYQVESSADMAIKSDSQFFESLSETREFETYQDALLDLDVSDRLDAVAVDKILIGYVISKEPGKYRVLEEGLGEEYYGIGCPKGAVALREAIDNALDELMEDGTIESISNEWFGSNIVIRDVAKITQEELDTAEE
ncbi:MAG: amino acid ABC transporter substrate-binding protein [Eubacteriales bacterium]|nr:amino acid ABC transporter substrate-binding protein [Eubacteriales bacterium]MDD4582639.1 amino acid ABC transporter substrate-binding protein [Eubacteriales bacterium]